MLTGLIKEKIKSNRKENRQAFYVPLTKEMPYFVRAQVKGFCGTVSDSCKIISKSFLAFASDSPIAAERAAVSLRGLRAGWPTSQAPHPQLPTYV